MALKTENITIDTTDPEKLADWWARALDGQVNPVAPPFFVVVTVPEGPGLAFQQVEDPTPGKNKWHLDLFSPDPAAAIQRALDLGATKKGDYEEYDTVWTTLADPEGNLFDVAAPH